MLTPIPAAPSIKEAAMAMVPRDFFEVIFVVIMDSHIVEPCETRFRLMANMGIDGLREHYSEIKLR